MCHRPKGEWTGQPTMYSRKPKDRSDPEGGIPGRYGPGDVCGTMRASPQARGRAAKRKREDERTQRRIAELDEQARIIKAVEGLRPRARKVWERLKQGDWYTVPTPAIQELIEAGLVVSGGRVARIVAAFLPVGSTPFQIESIPENLP